MEAAAADPAPEYGASAFGIETDAFIAEADARLRAIEAALAAIDDGSFGRCEICGEAVGEERLAARASARRCSEHEGYSTTEPRLF